MTISTLIWFFLGAFIVLVSFGGGFSLSRSSRRLGGEMYEETGRFISPDSTGQKLDDPQTLNRYSYCTNNPLKYIDPSGHDQVIVTNNDGTYTIMDGNGKLLANASEIDDLAQKMKDCESKSRGADLPLQKKAADYLKTTKNKDRDPF